MERTRSHALLCPNVHKLFEAWLSSTGRFKIENKGCHLNHGFGAFKYAAILFFGPDRPPPAFKPLLTCVEALVFIMLLRSLIQFSPCNLTE